MQHEIWFVLQPHDGCRHCRCQYHNTFAGNYGQPCHRSGDLSQQRSGFKHGVPCSNTVIAAKVCLRMSHFLYIVFILPTFHIHLTVFKVSDRPHQPAQCHNLGIQLEGLVTAVLWNQIFEEDGGVMKRPWSSTHEMYKETNLFLCLTKHNVR